LNVRRIKAASDQREVIPMSNLFTKFVVEPGANMKLGDIFTGYRRFHLHEATVSEAPRRVHAWQLPDLQQEFLVRPGSRVKLGEIDPGYRGRYESPEAAVTETRTLLKKLDRLQYVMHAERKHSLLIVLQGLDACGKDGVIRHMLHGMNPAGCRVVGFKRPRQEELDHDFLWRVHPHLPAKGEVSIFNRSHYEDVLVVRVHQFSQVHLWARRYDLINDFERLLAMENDTTVLKFFLYISKEEQLVRFKQRLDDPTRRWKISEADYRERAHWGRYTEAFEDMLSKTSTEHAPWFVIPSNHKWFRDLAVSQIVTRTLEDLEMKVPEPAVDIAAIRRKYHEADAEAQAS
jgi:PPK2 family polyphosphate:nucleotide phosphotransferase